MINGVSIKKDQDDNAKPKLQLPEKLSESRMVPHQSGFDYLKLHLMRDEAE